MLKVLLDAKDYDCDDKRNGYFQDLVKRLHNAPRNVNKLPPLVRLLQLDSLLFFIRKDYGWTFIGHSDYNCDLEKKAVQAIERCSPTPPESLGESYTNFEQYYFAFYRRKLK
ncbi:unnamed protein product [Angiostrongylus costaricensis]|uniref:DUF4413 domain-containing protein n=1 Tax=Angiostrongylus costaricensis TaxID=334426 RepID=A0A0R3PCZ0_ANGCS|nr:unnamed protein product [Angiostrongylus costaricensis]